MANHRSAEKRIRQTAKIRERNRARRSRLATGLKKIRSAVREGEIEQARSLLPETLSLLDRSAQKGAIHRNSAARRKSRLQKLVNAAEAAQ